MCAGGAGPLPDDYRPGVDADGSWFERELPADAVGADLDGGAARTAGRAGRGEELSSADAVSGGTDR